MSTEVIIMALVALLFVAFAVVAGMKAIKYVQTSNMMSAISQLATEIQYTFDGKYDDTQGTGSFTDENIYKLAPDSLKAGDDTNLKTKWGAITVAKETGTGATGFTISLADLPNDVCLKLSGFMKDSAKKVKVGSGTDEAEFVNAFMTNCSDNVTVMYTFN